MSAKKLVFAVCNKDCDSGWTVEENNAGERVICTYPLRELAAAEIADNHLMELENYIELLEDAINSGSAHTFLKDHETPVVSDHIVEGYLTKKGFYTTDGRAFSLDGQRRLTP